jgi:hypothetical protein
MSNGEAWHHAGPSRLLLQPAADLKTGRAKALVGSNPTPSARFSGSWPLLPSRDVLREVVVAFELAIEVAREHVRGIRDVAGHQRLRCWTTTRTQRSDHLPAP